MYTDGRELLYSFSQTLAELFLMRFRYWEAVSDQLIIDCL